MSPQQPTPGFARAGPGLVIFDFDGVLVDSEVISLSSLRQTLQDFGVSLTGAEVRERFLGGSMRQIAAYLQSVPAPAFPAEEFESRWYDILFERFRRELAPMPGALALLDHLDTLGHAYCIASGGSLRRLGVALEVTGLGPRFARRVYSADMVARGKPAPDIFLHAARDMGFSPDRCIVIEDSPAGVMAAHAAGMRSLGFVGGAHLRGRQAAHGSVLLSLHAETVVDDLTALRDWW